MRFIHYPPQLIGRGQWGTWRVTVTYQDGHTHSADYEAFTMTEAKRRYLMEFGAVHGGEIHVEIIQEKTLDKFLKLCYNIFTELRERWQP
jgi:hypothetical protein